MKKFNELVKVFSSLQGIGKKSAVRIAFDILEKPKEDVEKMINIIKDCTENINPCKICLMLSENEICDICSNEKRDKSIICIVENTRDVFAIENSEQYKGLYHVLGGKLDPLNGIGIDELNIKELITRLNDVKEIILALNPDIEGETTNLYLSKILLNKGIKVTKIASGIPMGGNIEFTDIMTLTKSIEGRQVIKSE